MRPQLSTGAEKESPRAEKESMGAGKESTGAEEESTCGIRVLTQNGDSSAKKSLSYGIEKLATVPKTKKKQVSKGTPGTQVHCYIVLQLCFVWSFSVSSSLLAAVLPETSCFVVVNSVWSC